MITRHTEIDLLRTIAIVLMVIYHAAYDLHAFYEWNIDLAEPVWETLRVTTVSLFLLLSGISSQFSRHPLKRSAVVLGCAALISIVTYLYDPDTFIRFGILHCIGFGMLLLITLKKLKEINIVFGLLILLYQEQLSIINYQFSILAKPALDYYPLIPWFGLMLIGAGIGHFLYIRKNFVFVQTQNIASLLGKYSLVIYMIHQPILLALLYTMHITY
jgi:uncharacterized membrane protein